MKRPWLEANGNTFPYRKLIHVASLKARIGWQSLRTDEFVDDGPYCVTGTDFQNGKINWSTAYHVSTERYEMDRNIQLAEGDLLVTKDGTIGKVAVVHGLNAPATLNSGVFVVRPKTNDLATDFLGWVIRSKVFDDFVAFNFSGSTINHLYQNVFETFRFPFPDLATQRQIADFLDRETARIDLLIEKKQRLVALLGEKETGLIDSLFFHDASAEKMTWKRFRVPQVRDGFQFRRLSYLCSLLRDGTHQPPLRVDEGFPLLSVRNIVDGKFVIREDDSKIALEDFRSLNRSFEVREGDVLLAVVGATLGKSAIVEKMPPVQIQRSLAIMRPISRLMDARYLLLFLRSGFFQDLLWSSTSFSAQPGVYLSSLGSFPIAVPSIAEQHKAVSNFDEKSRSLQRVKFKTNTSIDRLKEYRFALITAAVTGQIDVSTYAKSGTPDRHLDAIQEEMGA